MTSEDNVEVRVALARRLLETGHPKEALEEFEYVLTKKPAHHVALAGAVDAAVAANDEPRAEAYRLALRTHVHSPPPPPPDANRRGSNPPLQKRVLATSRPHLRLVSDDETADPSTRPVTFADVGGLTDVKRRLNRSFLLPLQQPERFARFGKSMRGGLVLYGPPGCGKTYVARALAGEIGARFMSIGLSDVLDMWLGESERKLHELFENARRNAPAVLFFDEVDALGQRRSNLRHSAGRNVVNQLLAELDGVGTDNRDVFVLGATNHPWDVDPALRRPGRFDRMVFVPAPDREARERILELTLDGRPVAPEVRSEHWSRKTEGFSGADLRALVDAATDLAFEHSVASGFDREIDNELMAKAAGDVRPSTRPWLETARNYAVYANEGGSYDDLLSYLRKIGLA